jgi:hypothetical protein
MEQELWSSAEPPESLPIGNPSQRSLWLSTCRQVTSMIYVLLLEIFFLAKPLNSDLPYDHGDMFINKYLYVW